MFVSKLLKHVFYCSLSCTPAKLLAKKNWTKTFKGHQIDIFCCSQSTIVINNSLAIELSFFISDFWSKCLANALNLGIEGGSY